ncbi:hypothetical protein [Armatimonas sp.]|uniref:hypothetical protein n=1 Tax=Armatimonas sp. TaxID=1872638 RepID=UPI0037534329
MKLFFTFGTVLLAVAAWPQEPAPLAKPFAFTFSGPSPAFNQPRGLRPAKTQAQFNLGAKLRVLESRALGKISVETDNLISTDAFDQAGRYGANLHYERPLVGSTLLVGRFGFAGALRVCIEPGGEPAGTQGHTGLAVGTARWRSQRQLYPVRQPHQAQYRALTPSPSRECLRPEPRADLSVVFPD